MAHNYFALDIADLPARKVHWSRPALESVTPQERRVDFENLYYQLKSEGLETLESMRRFYSDEALPAS